MEDLIKLYCMTMKCKNVNVEVMTKMFEQANMSFDGVSMMIFDLALQLDAGKGADLVELCEEIQQKANAISTVSLNFYGALYEMRGEPTPPSP